MLCCVEHELHAYHTYMHTYINTVMRRMRDTREEYILATKAISYVLSTVLSTSTIYYVRTCWVVQVRRTVATVLVPYGIYSYILVLYRKYKYSTRTGTRTVY